MTLNCVIKLIMIIAILKSIMGIIYVNFPIENIKSGNVRIVVM